MFTAYKIGKKSSVQFFSPNWQLSPNWQFPQLALLAKFFLHHWEFESPNCRYTLWFWLKTNQIFDNSRNWRTYHNLLYYFSKCFKFAMKSGEVKTFIYILRWIGGIIINEKFSISFRGTNFSLIFCRAAFIESVQVL